MFPGRLSVSRTIGDIEAKLEKFGGNPKVITAEAEVMKHEMNEEEDDFFLLGCDGIFDRMNNKEVVESAWKAIEESKEDSYHKELGTMVDRVLKESIVRRTFDNITVVVVAFKAF